MTGCQPKTLQSLGDYTLLSCSVVSPAVVVASSLALFLVAHTAQLLQIHSAIVCMIAVLVIYFCAEFKACSLYQIPIYYTRETQPALSVRAAILFKSSNTSRQRIVHVAVLMASAAEHSVAYTIFSHSAALRNAVTTAARVNTNRPKMQYSSHDLLLVAMYVLYNRS